MARRLPAVLGVLAVLAAIAALALLVHNPSIDGTSRGDGYPCLAAWDTVLNDADNFPGGETPPDAESIATRCVAAGRTTFAWSVGAAVVAVGFAATAVTLRLRRRR